MVEVAGELDSLFADSDELSTKVMELVADVDEPCPDRASVHRGLHALTHDGHELTSDRRSLATDVGEVSWRHETLLEDLNASIARRDRLGDDRASVARVRVAVTPVQA